MRCAGLIGLSLNLKVISPTIQQPNGKKNLLELFTATETLLSSLESSEFAQIIPKFELRLLLECQVMDASTILGNNDIDDVRWLCSLSEAELDLLMGLKTMVNMRAKKIGHEVLAQKFDLKMLRALSCIFMEHLKGKLKDVPVTSGFDSNLLKQNAGGSFASMTMEDLYPYICSDQRKRITDMFSDDMPPLQKQKTSKDSVV